MLLFDIQPAKLREQFDGWTLYIGPDANKKIKIGSLAKGSAALDPDKEIGAIAVRIQSACAWEIADECTLCMMPI